MTWFLAPSLVVLRDEVNARWRNRDKTSDGAVGDTSHAARKSSHNPLWSAPGKWSGVVRAIDVDSNGQPGERTPIVDAILKAAIGDSRVWYVIWNRRIWSRTTEWEPKPYAGSNAHDKHVHVSLNEDVADWDDRSPWLTKKPAIKPPEDEVTPADLEKIRAIIREENAAQTKNLREFIASVRQLLGKKLNTLIERTKPAP